MFGLGASIGAPWLLVPIPISCSIVRMDVPIADAIAATGGIRNFFYSYFSFSKILKVEEWLLWSVPSECVKGNVRFCPKVLLFILGDYHAIDKLNLRMNGCLLPVWRNSKAQVGVSSRLPRSRFSRLSKKRSGNASSGHFPSEMGGEILHFLMKVSSAFRGVCCKHFINLLTCYGVQPEKENKWGSCT